METAQTVQLGKSQVQVTPLGIGTWQWGDGKTYTEVDVKASFDVALEAGVGFFDTAEVYGMGVSERLVGRFIHQNGSQPVGVATKLFPFPWRLRKQSLATALRHSLERLGLKQVDLYQIHWKLTEAEVAALDAASDKVTVK